MKVRFKIHAVPGMILAAGILLSAAVGAESTREAMRDVYSSLSRILPIALSEELFQSPEGLESVEAALAELEKSAQSLTAHAGDVTAEFAGLARSFESNIALMRQSLDMGRYNEFNYLALDLTQNCVSCHSGLPAGEAPAFAAGLTEKVEDQLYTDLDRAQLQIATRQFDDAMTTLEGMIADAGTEPLDLELDGVLFDYLTIGITVTAQTQRVIDTLNGLRQREDLPYYMAHYAEQWAKHLESLGADLEQTPSLPRARGLFDDALGLSPIPSSQVRVVYDLAVSKMLRQLLASGIEDALERAEAYWMLAVISIRTVNPRPGVPHTEVLLDSAVRAAPGSDYAKRSYALLEEYNRLSFAGIPVGELPDPVLNMEELRELAGVPASR